MTPLPPTDAAGAARTAGCRPPGLSPDDGRRDGRLDRDRGLLLVIDVQEKLAPHVLDSGALVARIDILLAAAKRFAVPRYATEHCPRQIGALLPRLRAHFAEGEVFEKTRFGAAGHPGFVDLLRSSGRMQVLLAGMEAHVCVMQTALGLRALDFEVFVVADAVGSRAHRQEDRRLALDRLRTAGCVLLGSETALFEWTAGGDDAGFREMLALVKALPA